MNKRQDDMRIERYLSGLMEPAEAEAFRREMNVDDDLRRRVRVESLMVGALRAEREGVPVDHSAARSRALEAMTRIAPSGTSSAGLDAPSVDDGRAFLRGRTALGMLAGLLAVGAAGWGLYGGFGSPDPAASDPAPVEVRSERPAVAEPPTLPSETIAPVEPSSPISSPTPSVDATVRSREERHENATPRARTSASAASAPSNLIVPDLPRPTVATEARVDSATYDRTIPESRDSQARSRMNVNLPR